MHAHKQLTPYLYPISFIKLFLCRAFKKKEKKEREMFTLTFRVPFNFKKENETFGDSCDQEDDIGLSLTCLNQVGRP